MPDSNLGPRDLKSHNFPSLRPWTLNDCQTLDTNTAEYRCYEFSSATDTDQHLNLRVRLEKNHNNTCMDHLMKKRFYRWVFGLMNGLLVGRLAKWKDGVFDVWMAGWI